MEQCVPEYQELTQYDTRAGALLQEACGSFHTLRNACK